MIHLFRHNQVAYEAAVSLLQSENKAAIIHPTGSGKSFIGFKLCEENKEKHVCWLSPSEYIYKNQLENLAKTGADIPENITFYTYAKLMLLKEEELEQIQPDYIVLDEFHRCGAQMWGKGVEALLSLYKEAKILGLSATHIRYLDNQRDMAEELFEGNVASEITLGEAIVQGILSAPKYITTLYSYQEELERYEKRVQKAKNQIIREHAEEYLEALRRALEMSEGLDVIFERHIQKKDDKYLVFCANKEHLDEMIGKVPQWFHKIDSQPHVYHVYSDDAESEKTFEQFKSDNSKHLKLLFCIDMLNEGVHIEGISGIIMFRPTISPIIYKQQVGRTLSTTGNAMPVIFDIVNNIESLYSIDAIEEEMKEAIIYFRENEKQECIVTETFSVYEEIQDCRALFQGLNDMLGQSWEMMYSLAKNYYNVHHNLDIPKRYKTPEGHSLGSWLSVQRRVRKGEASGKLTPERIQLLDEIGMQWENVIEANYQKHLQCAEAYYQKFGNLNVEVDYTTEEGVKLGTWISGVRRQYAIGSLSEERIQTLENMGMIWEKFSYLWQQGLAAAEAYYTKHGNLDVNATYIDENHYRLGMWINVQKRAYRENRLEQEQIEALERLQIQWNGKYDTGWNRKYNEAKKYYETNGNLNVPVQYKTESGFKLGVWLANQRKNTGIKVIDERRQKLDAIGMVWNKRDTWDERYEVAKSYYQKHGHLRVPSQEKIEGLWLNKWLNEQKQIQIGNRPTKSLTKEQVEKMEAIGMVWTSRKAKYCPEEYYFEVGM